MAFGKWSLNAEKATAGTTFRSHASVMGAIRLFFRFFQFLLGIVVIGLYAVDVDRARRAHKGSDSRWTWAVVCGTLGSITALVFMIPLVKSWFFFFVDILIWLCYLIAFAIFGKLFIKEHPEGDKGIKRMKNGVWVLLTNMLLWFLTAIFGAVIFWRERHSKTVHTGRGSQHV